MRWARLRAGARLPAALDPDRWYPVVRRDQHGLWLDGGGDDPVAVPPEYVDELRRTAPTSP